MSVFIHPGDCEFVIPEPPVSSVCPKPLETDNSSGSLETGNSEEALEAISWEWFGNHLLGITRNQFSGEGSRKKSALRQSRACKPGLWTDSTDLLGRVLE